MQVASFTGHQYVDLLTLQYLQAKPTRGAHLAGLFLLLFLCCITWRRTHFYSLPHNVFFPFQLQAVCQLGIFNLPVGLA